MPPRRDWEWCSLRDRAMDGTRTLVSGSEAGKTAGEVELGWVGPLIPRECGGSERASPGLS